MKRLVSLLLLACMLFSFGLINASADEEITLKWLIASGTYDIETDLDVEGLEKMIGFNLELEQVNGTEQLMLIITTGQAYDYVYLSTANYNLMMSEGALMDITDLLDEHGQEIVAAMPSLWPSVTTDGRIYAIPAASAQPDSLTNSLIGRMDLIKAIGYEEVPTTLDGFVKMLEDLKAAYPEMVPMTAPSNWLFYNIASAFNVQGMYQLMDGKVINVVDNPNLKAYIECLRDLYARGLLDNEMPALNATAERAKFSSSQAVIYYENWSGVIPPIQALRALVPEMEYDVLPLLEDENGKVHAQVKWGVTQYGAIPVTAEHPVETIKAINTMIEIENFTEIVLGTEGVHHYVGEDGKLYPIQPAFNDEKNASNVLVSGFYREVEYPAMWEVRLKKDADLEYVFYAMRDSLLDGGERSPVALAPAVTVVDNKATLEAQIKDTLIAVIAGTKDISELDTLKAYWNDNGGKEIIEFYNDWYAENMAK